jgi:mannosyltransferase
MFKLFFKKRTHDKIQQLDWGILVGGLAIFAAITLTALTNSSIWFDEAFGAYMIRFDFTGIAAYTAADVHPPLYYWLLKLWSMAFGTSEMALRSMTVLFAATAIVFGFLLAHRLFGRKAAWLSLLFMILSPLFIRYSQEMRMYGLVAAIGMAATYVLTFAVENKGKKYWVLYGILISLGMWTHIFSAIIWLSHWVWRAAVVRMDGSKKLLRRFFSREWIWSHILAVGVFLPWLPVLLKQIFDVQVNGFWIPPVTPGTVPNFLTNVVYYQDLGQVNGWFALGFLLIMTSGIVLAAKVCGRLSKEQKKSYLLIASVAFAPIAIVFLLSLPPLQSMFIDRYLVVSSLMIAVFMGTTLVLSRPFMKTKYYYGLVVLIVAAMIVGIANVYHLGNYNKTLGTANNTRQIFEAVVKNSNGNEPIIADSPWLFYEAVFYETPSHPVYFIDANTKYEYGSLNMLKNNDMHKIKDLNQFSRDHKIVWILARPEANDVVAPNYHWKKLQQVEFNDSITGKAAYKAARFQTN